MPTVLLEGISVQEKGIFFPAQQLKEKGIFFSVQQLFRWCFYIKRFAGFGGCLHVKFHPGMKSSLSMVKCLLLFTRFCRDEISSRDERQGWNFIPGWKKEKKTCKHFILGWNFKMSMYLISFWRMYSNMLSKVNVFEHDENMNEWNIRPLYKESEVPKEKEWRQQVNNQKRKNILFLLFSLWRSEKTEIPFCFNLIP